MKALITGGAGFIGSHLADRLIKDGHKVTVIDNLSAGDDNLAHIKTLGVDFHQVDIASYDAIKDIFKGQDTVFHLAAMNRAGRSIADPLGAHAANATGTLNVFEAARQAKVTRGIVFVSSSSVLGGSEGTLTADTPYNPLHPYGVGKAVGEMYAKIYNDLYDQNITILRYFSIYGPRQKGNLDYPAVIAKLVMLAFQGKPLTVYGDGKQLRNYTYVDDAVEATIKAVSAKAPKNRILHVANPNEYSILDIVEAIKRLVPGKVEIVYEALVAPEPRRNFPDTSETQKFLDWAPRVDLEEGVKRYIDWYKNNLHHFVKE